MRACVWVRERDMDRKGDEQQGDAKCKRHFVDEEAPMGEIYLNFLDTYIIS